MVAAASSDSTDGGGGGPVLSLPEPPAGAAAADGLLLLGGGGDVPSAAAANGDGRSTRPPSQWPLGFRFHPTDEELLLYYLKRKICRRRIPFHMIAEVDVYKCEPWELPEKSVLRSGDKQWYFFSPRDRKYPNGSRSNRATKRGYWKATGKDRNISQNSQTVGTIKTLVFYCGRAPKGERTDWVMHEYTMDEQELMKCNNVKDSYAIYKVYRKSGPGPKNGEQYGAPFREEEWEDDPIDDDISKPITEEHPPLMLPHGNLVGTAEECERGPPQIEDLENFLLQIEDDMGVDFKTEVESHMLESALIEVTSTEQNDAWLQHEPLLRRTSSEVVQSAAATLEPSEMCEAVSAFDCFEQDHQMSDFLEIHDFDVSRPSLRGVENASNNSSPGVENGSNNSSARVESVGNNCVLRVGNVHSSYQFDGTDLFYESCEYFDPTSFLSEITGPPDQVVTDPCYLDFVDDGIQSLATQLSNHPWRYDQNPYVSMAAEPNQVVMAPPSSGALPSDSLTNQVEQTQMQNGHRDGPPDDWMNYLSSVLLDSVPARPALASENALIGRAFKRISSFGAGRIDARNPNTTTGGVFQIARRREGHKSGFLFLSFLVALAAVFWVLTVASVVKVSKALVGRFISS